MADPRRDLSQHDTKTGDFTDRPDVEELGGSSSEGILEVTQEGANIIDEDTPGRGGTPPLGTDDEDQPRPPARPDEVPSP